MKKYHHFIIESGFLNNSLVKESEIKEKLRGGRGKLGPKDALDIDLDASDFKGGEKAFIKFASTKFKIRIIKIITYTI